MHESDLAREGSETVRDLLASTSERLRMLVERHEEEMMALAAGTEAGAARLASERLREVIKARRELTERASEIAVRLEAMLDRLEAVEAELRSQIGPEDELKERRRIRWWSGIFRRAA